MRQITLLLGLLAITVAAAGCGGAGAPAGPMLPGPAATGPASGGGGDTAVRPLVQGRIVFEGQETVSFSEATVDVHLVDSGSSSSRLVAGQRMHDVAFEYDAAAGNGLPFIISGRKPDTNGVYFVSVRIDVDGDGEMGRGDYQSRENALHAADLSQNPDQVTVTVEKLP